MRSQLQLNALEQVYRYSVEMNCRVEKEEKKWVIYLKSGFILKFERSENLNRVWWNRVPYKKQLTLKKVCSVRTVKVSQFGQEGRRGRGENQQGYRSREFHVQTRVHALSGRSRQTHTNKNLCGDRTTHSVHTRILRVEGDLHTTFIIGSRPGGRSKGHWSVIH